MPQEPVKVELVQRARYYYAAPHIIQDPAIIKIDRFVLQTKAPQTTAEAVVINRDIDELLKKFSP